MAVAGRRRTDGSTIRCRVRGLARLCPVLALAVGAVAVSGTVAVGPLGWSAPSAAATPVGTPAARAPTPAVLPETGAQLTSLGARLTGVACTSAATCVAVGALTSGPDTGYAVIVSFTLGTGAITVDDTVVLTQTDLQYVPVSTLSGVACPDQTECLATYRFGGVLPFTLSSLTNTVTVGTPTQATAAQQDWNGVTCLSADTCIAVGAAEASFSGGVGLTGAVVPLYPSASGTGVSFGSIDYGAAPTGGAIGTYKGVSCPPSAVAPVTCVTVGAVFGTVTPVVVTGPSVSLGTGPVLGHFNGDPLVYGFNGVTCPVTTECVALGYGTGRNGYGSGKTTFGGQVVAFPVDPATGTIPALTTTRAYEGGSAIVNVAGTGQYGFFAGACATPTECVAVGTGFQSAGTSNHAPVLPISVGAGGVTLGTVDAVSGTGSLESVVCPTATRCVAAGDTAILAFDPATLFAPAPGGTTGALSVTEVLGSGNAATNVAISCVGDPVNCATGNFSETATDASVPGRGPGLKLTRTYNSAAAATPTPFGYGWSDSYAMSLSQSATGTVTIAQEDGSTVTFAPDGTGGYAAPAYVFATLVHEGDGTWTFTRRGTAIFTFSPTGQLLSVSDPDGDTTTLTYGPSGNLERVTDPAGRSLTFAYGTGGLVSSVTDPAGNVTRYAYDTAGNLVSVTDPLGNVTAFGYGAGHLLDRVVTPGGGVTTVTYDGEGRAVAVVDPLGRTTAFSYSTGKTTVTEPDGSTTEETFSDYELTSRTTEAGTPQAATTTYAYDPSTLSLTGVTNPDGNTTTYTYDAHGNVTSVTDPLGRVTRATYNAFDEPLTKTTPLGVTTTYTYDSRGNLLSVSTPLAGTAQVQTVTYVHGDPLHPGDVTAMVDPDGNTTTYAYDAQGDLVSVTDPLGDTTTYAYDVLGRETASTAPAGNVDGAERSASTTTYRYDALGRLLATTGPLGRTTTYTYDAAGNELSTTDPAGHTTTYAYDLDNELLRTTAPDGAVTTEAYDADGNVVSRTDADGHTTTYTYDARGEELSTTDPLGRTTTFTYDPAGNRLTATDPDGQVTTDAYNAANELVSISYSSATTPGVTYTYDADGRVVSMTDGTGTTTDTYDSLGRLVSSTDGAGQTVRYGYDLDDDVTAVTYPNGQTVTQGYDAAGHLTSVTDWLGHTSTFAYDANGQVTTERFGSDLPVADTYAYDAAGEVVSATHAGSPRGGAVGYTYTPDGLMTGAVTAPPPARQQFTYDTQGRLTGSSLMPARQDPPGPSPNRPEPPGRSVPPGGPALLGPLPPPGPSSQVSSYTYDPAGNLISMASRGPRAHVTSSSTLTYDAAGELRSAGRRGQTTSFSYNGEGDRTLATPPSGPPTNYTFDQAGELTGFSRGPTAATYAYDGNGLLRTETTSSGTSPLAWETVASVPLLLSDGGTSFLYGPGGLPIEMITGTGQVYDYHHDQVGSTVSLTDLHGRTVATYAYSGYGALVRSTPTVPNPLLFDGQYRDPVSGLSYFHARFYDPTTGQFLSVDPLVAQTGQPYQYAADDPVNRADTTGLATEFFVCGVASVEGVVAGGFEASDVICNYWGAFSATTTTVGANVAVGASFGGGVTGQLGVATVAGPQTLAGGSCYWGASGDIVLGVQIGGACTASSVEIGLSVGAEGGGTVGVGVATTCVVSSSTGWRGCTAPSPAGTSPSAGQAVHGPGCGNGTPQEVQAALLGDLSPGLP